MAAFAGKQALLMTINEIGAIDTIRREFSSTDPRDIEENVDIAISVAGSRTATSQLLAELIVGLTRSITESDAARLLTKVDAQVEAATPASALGGFRRTWRTSRGLAVEATQANSLANATASNDVASVGRQLGATRVNEVEFMLKNLPESLVRRPLRCSMLELAVGANAVEMTKYLLEFHGALPSREALKMSISTGNPELIRLVWQRLPEVERFRRDDLLEVAADFHHEAPLGWLFRDANLFERELFASFALERHLADAVLVGLRNGLRPWWSRTRELAATWAVASELEFFEPPEGCHADGGWWTSASGSVSPFVPATSNLTACLRGAREAAIGLVFPPGHATIDFFTCAFWSCLKAVTFPPKVTSIGSEAFRGCSALTELVIPGGAAKIGAAAFMGCSGLKALTIPLSVSSIGFVAFNLCSGLKALTIPSNVMSIGQEAFKACSGLSELVILGATNVGFAAFGGCSALTELEISTSADVDKTAFEGVTSIRRLVLLGTTVSPGLVIALDACSTPDAVVVSAALAGERFGRRTIVAA